MAPLAREHPWFQENRLPSGTRLVGYSALVATLDVQAPVRRPSCVSAHHRHGGPTSLAPWRVFGQRAEPGDTIEAHLLFALKREDLDLTLLKRILEAWDETDLATLIRGTPTGITHRRLWYLYEHLTGRTLDIPDAAKVQAVDLLDPTRYFTVPGEISTRHRVRDNLLGVAAFCPVIRRTPALDAFFALNLAACARATVGRVSSQLVTRAASFMLLADSQASYAIEGERPPRNRLERWGRAVLEAGRRPLGLDELERLQAILIGDDRFVTIGLRPDGVFLGERGHDGAPIPEFIGARPVDLRSLLQGLFACSDRMQRGGVDPVLHAAVLAFGFVYIHPFQDGNGRIHRCLVHQVLAARGFTPAGLVFPVSSVMAENLPTYQATLRAHSAPLMPFIDWQPTPERNVAVTNQTADLYRYVDCTEAAKFLYGCVRQTVEVDFPRELSYLQRHDQAAQALMACVQLSDLQAADFIMFVRQNGGTLSKRRRDGPFARLTDEEVHALEALVVEAFDG